MAALTIYLFATTTNPTPLYMSDDGTHWKESDDYSTTVAALDTVQFLYNHKKDSITNNITGITGITPAKFYQPSNHPKKSNDWKGKIKEGNKSKGVETYTVRYNVTGKGNQSQDPKLKMNA